MAAYLNRIAFQCARVSLQFCRSSPSRRITVSPYAGVFCDNSSHHVFNTYVYTFQMHKKLYIVWIICFINLTMLLSELIKIMWQADFSRVSIHQLLWRQSSTTFSLHHLGWKPVPRSQREYRHAGSEKFDKSDFSTTRNMCFIAEVFENNLSVQPSCLYWTSSRLRNFADYSSTSETDQYDII